MMAAFLFIQGAVSDKARYKAYQEAVQPLIGRFDGRLLASGWGLEVLEGGYDGRRLVVFEFPSMERLKAFWNSPDYIEVKRIRAGAAELDIWAVQGAD
jgi:uncharacterized protein (DUF1330 family)